MNAAAIRYEIKKMIISGGIGLSSSELIDLIDVIRMYPIAELPTVIVNLPKSMIRDPIPLVMKKVLECLRAKTNAAIAELQKFSPVRATWM